MKRIAFALCMTGAALSMACQSNAHLMKDGKTRRQVAELLEARAAWLPALPDGITDREREGLEFLYAYMPLGDVADYEPELYLRNVQAALEARGQMPWGEGVPDELFLHYVLPIRVNNENLDTARVDFFAELKDRVKGLSMEDAILEVNHWCHEHVIYTPSDGRTMAPGALVRTGEGRCGEESTFTVTALRAVGIPARQVYTPRWAHTDNNHAWIEAWAGGRWYYMGACEPEPVLNMGWFDAPSARGMLMHTNIFGQYGGADEEVIQRNPMFTEINVTKNYAPVSTAAVTVRDTAGGVVAGATVEFCIYNYAEYYPAARRITDSYGRTDFTAGRGDMIVWATDGEWFGYDKLSFGRQDSLEIVLKHRGNTGERYTIDWDIVPPEEAQTQVRVTPQQRAENDRRMAREDSIRGAYIATWITEMEAHDFALRQGLDPERVWNLLDRSRGNYAAILAVLEHGVAVGQKQVAMELLETVARKDLQDTPAEVLIDHLDGAMGYKDRPYFREYILNPRVDRELLVAYRGVLAEVVGGLDMEGIIARARGVELVDSLNPAGIPISALGVLKLSRADRAARDRYFIAMARTKGVPARHEPITERLQYYDLGGGDNKSSRGWTYVDLDEADFDGGMGVAGVVSEEVGRGVLSVDYSPTRLNPDPKYFSHFAIAKLNRGRYETIELASPDDDMGASGSLAAIFRRPVALEAGDYMLVSGSRMASGTVLGQTQFFSIAAGGQTTVRMQMREDVGAVQVIGQMNSEQKFTAIGGDGLPMTVPQSILTTAGRGYFVVALLGVNQEPTNHVLRDMAALRAEFERWGRKMIFIFRTAEQWEKFRPQMARFGQLPATIVYGVDTDGGMTAMLKQSLEIKNMDELPLVVVGDTFNRVVFSSQGYTIGLGERLMQVITQL